MQHQCRHLHCLRYLCGQYQYLHIVELNWLCHSKLRHRIRRHRGSKLCTSGYTSSGTPSVVCSANAGTFTVSDACVAKACTLSSSTGYVTTSCDTRSGAITTASCSLSCASGYTSSVTPSVACSTNAGTFTVSVACGRAGGHHSLSGSLEEVVENRRRNRKWERQQEGWQSESCFFTGIVWRFT